MTGINISSTKKQILGNKILQFVKPFITPPCILIIKKSHFMSIRSYPVYSFSPGLQSDSQVKGVGDWRE